MKLLWDFAYVPKGSYSLQVRATSFILVIYMQWAFKESQSIIAWNIWFIMVDHNFLVYRFYDQKIFLKIFDGEMYGNVLGPSLFLKISLTIMYVQDRIVYVQDRLRVRTL